jgi:multicomponent Na+:H+ antiporter subunit E
MWQNDVKLCYNDPTKKVGGIMNTLRKHGILIFILTFIWSILNGNFRLSTIFVGIIVSFITMYILNIIQPHQNEQYNYNTSPFLIFLFLLLLFKNIYVSAFKTIIHLIKGEINPQFVSTDTQINRLWLQSIVANAITLTPGTVTVHMADNAYTILWLYPLTIRQKDIKNHIFKDFEDLIKKGDQHA